MTEPDSRADPSTALRRWLPLVAICIGSAMLLIDVSIVNVALPQLTNGLDASMSALQWVIDAYALALAALLLGVGALADITGHRRTYLAGLVVFATASLGCGLAPTVAVLDVARGVQGAGAAAMLACTTALLNSTYRGAERGVAFGLWAAVSSAATAVGPVLGGLLVQTASWRWIFIVNVPLSVVAITLTLRFVAADSSRARRSVDVPGMLTFTTFAAALTYALIHFGEHGAATVTTWTYVGVAVVGLAAFLVIETRRARTGTAMFDLALFRHRVFTAAMIASAVSTLCAFAALTYSTIWLQTVVGLTPIEAGLTGLPLAAASFVVSVLVGPRLQRRPGPVIAVGMLLVGAGSLLDAGLLTGSASWPQLMPGTVLTGLGAGLVLPTLTAAAMGAVEPRFGGMAAGSLSTVRQLGFAIGIAVLGSLVTARAADRLATDGVTGPDGLARALVSGQAHSIAPTVPVSELHLAALDGLDSAFLVAGVLAFVTAGVVYLLARPRDETADPRAKPAPTPTAS
ncbi:MFS transporter [Amycolatopsis rhizosphaerae]|uniref:MFS transporter n=1 Tax=Amycolatopsis rhizosphaerae TaxID=2053003 RepID=UPI001C96BC2B|nr:MFS transporter [Amycolatopsis rhizosphaerae]